MATRRKSSLTVRQRRLRHMRKIILRDLADDSSSDEGPGTAGPQAGPDADPGPSEGAGHDEETDNIKDGVRHGDKTEKTKKKENEEGFKRRKLTGKLRKRSPGEDSE